MKLPEKIKGINRIRDTKILHLYADGKSMEEIGSSFGISGSRVQQVLYKNRDLLELDKKYERAKRVNWLRRQHVKAGDSEKDSADILEQMRKEIEGDDRNPGSSVNEVKVIVVYPPTAGKPNEVIIATPSNRVESIPS